MRQYFKLAAVTIPLVIVAACSDSSTSPQPSATRSLSVEAPVFDYSAGGRLSFGDRRTSFTVTPSGGTFSINRIMAIQFPANSVCDPTVSSYGPTEWDNDCVTLTHDIQVTATTRLTASGMQVDFEPNLRFAPGKEVVLSTDIFAPTLRYASGMFRVYPSMLRGLSFYYASSMGAAPVADYKTDPSLVTHVDLQTGRVWRRVKHFSGYLQTSGAACEPSAGDPDCIQADGP